ncbi:Scr1 family TA system antitoxin-like transcriptional regulator [Spirillospora sp. NPDC048911]|uniref:Scr1 family TA system antitoxin-like transcriptional regulator n=1 Tax=Spirillospora sp. NPDC048911 TaxID=3364527 RepID=UPI00371BB245
MGSAETMRAQFDSLFTDSRRPHVDLQVLPFDRGLHTYRDFVVNEGVYFHPDG